MMKKTIQIIDDKLMEEFMCIFSLGLLEGIAKKAICPLRAEQWLFSPVIAYNLKKSHYSKEFKEAIEFASETDAASHFSSFEQGLMKNKELFLKALQKNVDTQQNTTDHFLEGILEEN